ncbi:MAG: biotin transporter BioY [Thermoleophilia bacterium]
MLALAGLFTAVVAVSSWVSVPLPISPVPLTLQTLAVLVAGGLLGRTWGPVCVFVYLLVGVVGVPVFSSFGAGPGVLFGPTGGYLVGFVPAAFLMGVAGDWVRARGEGGAGKLGVLVVGAVAASVVVYAAGVPWLALVTGMSVRAAAVAGMVPYLFGDVVKAVAAVALVRSVDAALRAQGAR